MTWGSNSTGKKSTCRHCGQDEFDDLDEWPYTTHYYECQERGLWNQIKKLFRKSNLPEARVVKR